MKQEEKMILVREISARVPFGVICAVNGSDFPIKAKGVDLVPNDEFDWVYSVTSFGCEPIPIGCIKPYLRPLSSMTIEEKIEFEKIVGYWECGPFEKNYDNIITHYNLNYRGINNLCTWLYKNHFDFNELIPMGLAIAVTKENNPYKKDNQ